MQKKDKKCECGKLTYTGRCKSCFYKSRVGSKWSKESRMLRCGKETRDTGKTFVRPIDVCAECHKNIKCKE